MRHFLALTPRTLVVLALLVLGSACNNQGGTKAPRISTIPQQRAAGGTTFTLDLAPYVEDDTQTASYSVLSGGGSFTGSIYTRQFPTLGTYPVAFRVTDFRGESSDGDFGVKVTSAELAVVRTGSGISLLDLQTGHFASALPHDGRAKTFQAALQNGSLIIEVSNYGQTDLWLFNPNVAGTDVFAGDSIANEVFGLKTANDRIVYVKGSAPSRALFLYDPFNRGTTSFGVTGQGTRDERDPMLDGELIYFESAQGGQADIYAYRLTTGQVTPVSTHAEDEELVTVLPGEGVVFRRRGSGGEWHLYCFRSGPGVVEIGSDLSSAVQSESKELKATTSTSRVVFETTDAGGDHDLYIWSPGDGQTTAIAASAVDETFAGLSGSGRVVYHLQTAPGNRDLVQFNPDSSTGGTIAATADDESWCGTLANGDVIFARDTGSGIDLYHWDQSLDSAAAFPDAATTVPDQVFAKVLTNDDVVYTAGGNLSFYRPGASASTSVDTAAGTEAFAGETLAGDFVISLTTGSDVHLYLWENGSSAAVAVSVAAGSATYEAASSDGKVLYSRVDPAQTTSNLFSFLPATAATVQVTDNTTDDNVAAVVQAVVIE